MHYTEIICVHNPHIVDLRQTVSANNNLQSSRTFHSSKNTPSTELMHYIAIKWHIICVLLVFRSQQESLYRENCTNFTIIILAHKNIAHSYQSAVTK